MIVALVVLDVLGFVLPLFSFAEVNGKLARGRLGWEDIGFFRLAVMGDDCYVRIHLLAPMD